MLLRFTQRGLLCFKLASYRVVSASLITLTDCKVYKLPNSFKIWQSNFVKFSSFICNRSQQFCNNCSLLHVKSLNGWTNEQGHGGNLCYRHNKSKRMMSSISSDDDKSNNSVEDLNELLTEIRDDFKKDSSDGGSDSSSSEVGENVLKEGNVPEIEDVEDFGKVEQSSAEPAWTPSISLIRGECGVFDIEELCTVLEHENAKDLCVIEIPKEARFADFMVIVSGLSNRHMRAMLARIHWIHKRKKSRHDSNIKIEGLDSDTWFAVDLGNIILHIFMPNSRELYDLETLWTVGAKYDDNCRETESPYSLSEADLLSMQFNDRSTEQKPK